MGGMLGDEHDLAVLEATLAAEAPSFGAAMRPLGQRLFAEPPPALARRFAAYWRAAQTEGDEHRQVA